MTRLKVAVCMRGAIAKIPGNGLPDRFTCKDSLYNNNAYIDYKKCYNSIIKYIVEPNNELYDFDFFCQSWNPDLEDELCRLYNPKETLFEDNRTYNDYIEQLCTTPSDFGGVSHALAMKKVIELKEKYEAEHAFTYDIVILYRYDILLWKVMRMGEYANLQNIVYVNGHGGANGDFHFIMNSGNSSSFKYLVDSISKGNKHQTHYWIKNYIQTYMHKNIVADSIPPGIYQEVIRKIYECSIRPGHLSISLYNSI